MASHNPAPSEHTIELGAAVDRLLNFVCDGELVTLSAKTGIESLDLLRLQEGQCFYLLRLADLRSVARNLVVCEVDLLGAVESFRHPYIVPYELNGPIPEIGEARLRRLEWWLRHQVAVSPVVSTATRRLTHAAIEAGILDLLMHVSRYLIVHGPRDASGPIMDALRFFRSHNWSYGRMQGFVPIELDRSSAYPPLDQVALPPLLQPRLPEALRSWVISHETEVARTLRTELEIRDPVIWDIDRLANDLGRGLAETGATILDAVGEHEVPRGVGSPQVEAAWRAVWDYVKSPHKVRFLQLTVTGLLRSGLLLHALEIAQQILLRGVGDAMGPIDALLGNRDEFDDSSRRNDPGLALVRKYFEWAFGALPSPVQ